MTDRDATLKPREDSGKATAEDGVVLLDGPDGVAVTMTADAADETANSLHEAARQARIHLSARQVPQAGSEQGDPDAHGG